MNRVLLFLTVCLITGFSAMAKETLPVTAPAPEQTQDPVEAALSALDAGNRQGAEEWLGQITDPAASLYVKARIERAAGEPKRAIQTLVQVMALHYQDKNWIAKSDLLCAELYLEMGMLEAADATARQMQTFYEGSEILEKAKELRSKIEKRIEIEKLKEEGMEE